MENPINIDWLINGNLNAYKFSKFLEKLLDKELFSEVITNYELLVKEGYTSQLNDFCKRHYCKALYSLLKQEESMIKCVEYVDKITSNSEQMSADKEHYNQHVNSIKFLIKKIKKSNNPNYRTIYTQLSKLNPDILSTSEMELSGSDGRSYINVSSKELYYTQYIKSLIKLENFHLAINVAEKALKNIEKWNYENDIWIMSRVHYAKCRLAENFEEDIKSFKEFADFKNKWFIYSKVADVLFRQGFIDECISYYAKAIVVSSKSNIDALVNVMYDFAILIIDKHEDIAKDLISQCYQTREFHGWNISPSLKFHLKFLQINNFAKVNFKILQKKVIKLTNMHHGEIKMFNQEQNFGFIKMSNGTDIYFKGDKKNSKEYKENRKVFFDIDYDIKKNKNRAKNLFFSD